MHQPLTLLHRLHLLSADTAEAGLIQSLSQAPLPKVAACGVLEGIASIPCLNSLLPQLILI
jgi:hypothetical protein